MQPVFQVVKFEPKGPKEKKKTSSILNPKAHELDLIFGSNLSLVENFCLAVI
jgi:hypothetical protein